jgi:hypothetical protein
MFSITSVKSSGSPGPFDKNTKYPDLHEHLLTTIKVAQDNKEQGVLDGIDRCVTHIVSNNIMRNYSAALLLSCHYGGIEIVDD